MIVIDRSSCTNCGICKLRCPACFTEAEGRIEVRDEGKRCINCGHCISLCPADAITHACLPFKDFSPVSPLGEIPPESFERLVRRRRSHRQFQNKPIPKEVLTRIINTCRYAPTGVNAQDVAVNVIRSPEQIRRASRLAVDHFVRTTERLDKEMARLEEERQPIPDPLRLAVQRNGRYRRMGNAFDKGFDPIFHKAAAALIFHAPKNAPTPRDDCIIAAHTAVLHAELLGLGTCYIGLFTRAAAENPHIPAEMNLPEGNRIYATLIMGYPALKFLKIPPRSPISTCWK